MANELTKISDWEEKTRRLVDLLEPITVAGLYVMSIASWIYGGIFGLVTMTQCKLEANKRVGKICLILGLVNLALILLLVVAYVVIIALAIFGTAWFASCGSTG